MIRNMVELQDNSIAPKSVNLGGIKSQISLTTERKKKTSWCESFVGLIIFLVSMLMNMGKE